ncbi:MAG: AAA family ATPase [bacterium]
MQRIGKLVNLNQAERCVLEFMVSMQCFTPLEEAVLWLGKMNLNTAFKVLSKTLGLPSRRVQAAFAKTSVLHRSGLLRPDPGINCDLNSNFDLLNALDERIMLHDLQPEGLLENMVMLGKSPQLSLKDYPHIKAQLKVLRVYLKRACTSRRRGANILLYGPPGTGKTELARALATTVRRELFEVASVGDGGDSMYRFQRRRVYGAAQYFFARKRALILFDEAEDVFGADDADFVTAVAEYKSGKGKGASKGGINCMLEGNALPTIWTSNSVRGIDPAYARRFDMVMELPTPPKSVRERIMRNACGDSVGARMISRIAESASLSPAVVTRASEVVGLIRRDLNESEIEPAFETLINNVLEVQRHRPIRRHDPNRLSQIYDPAFINADLEPAPIADALVCVKRGRLCLYGAPGTGKTAFARWVAMRMEASLVVKRASDLLSNYVGGSEQNIAEAFKQAECENAVLVIDEMDSFLRDRRSAVRSWEVTQVNEMLTQIESFAGVFIATTNLMDNLDQAALRRFDFKIKFDFLRAEQAWALLTRHCAELDLPAPDAKLKPRLARLTNLTPGDFATVARQSALRPIANSEEWIAALDGECELKEGVKQAIGFC